jgi:type II secretory pathway pseudopilin PulG
MWTIWPITTRRRCSSRRTSKIKAGGCSVVAIQPISHNSPAAGRIRSTGSSIARKASDEAGYILLGVLILLFLFTLVLAIAAPSVAKSIQRDRDEEAVRRGDQYKRAIRKYYKKFNTYPTTVAQLENTNQIRFLRKRYLDPITGKDDWRLIHVGQAKVPVLGFFGQPLQAGTSSVTTGLSGNGTGGLSGGASIFGQSGTTGSTGGFGSTSAGSTTGSGDGSTPAPVGVLPGMSAGAGAPGGAGTSGTGTTGSGFSNSNSSTSTGFSSGDATMGPIVGVGVPVEKKSLVIYHKQDAYNKWEFTYDPVEEQMFSGTGGVPGAQPAGSGGNAAGIGSNSGFGSSTGSSPSGSGFGFSNQPSTGNGGTSGNSGTGSGTSTTPNSSSPN